MTQEPRPITLQITFDLRDDKGGIGNFIVTPTGIPKPLPLGTLIKWSKTQQECLEPTIQLGLDGQFTMPEINRAFSILRGLLATTIFEGKVPIPDTKDWHGWLLVLEYWKELVRKKMK